MSDSSDDKEKESGKEDGENSQEDKGGENKGESGEENDNNIMFNNPIPTNNNNNNNISMSYLKPSWHAVGKDRSPIRCLAYTKGRNWVWCGKEYGTIQVLI